MSVCPQCNVHAMQDHQTKQKEMKMWFKNTRVGSYTKIKIYNTKIIRGEPGLVGKCNCIIILTGGDCQTHEGELNIQLSTHANTGWTQLGFMLFKTNPVIQGKRPLSVSGKNEKKSYWIHHPPSANSFFFLFKKVNKDCQYGLLLLSHKHSTG